MIFLTQISGLKTCVILTLTVIPSGIDLTCFHSPVGVRICRPETVWVWEKTRVMLPKSVSMKICQPTAFDQNENRTYDQGGISLRWFSIVHPYEDDKVSMMCQFEIKKKGQIIFTHIAKIIVTSFVVLVPFNEVLLWKFKQNGKKYK